MVHIPLATQGEMPLSRRQFARDVGSLGTWTSGDQVIPLLRVILRELLIRLSKIKLQGWTFLSFIVKKKIGNQKKRGI